MACNPTPVDPCTAAQGSTIADALSQLGPRTVEGDYGRITMHSVNDAIAASEYQRKRCSMKSRSSTASAIRSLNYRLVAHDGPGT